MGCNESGRCAEKRFFCFSSSPSFFREGRKRVARPAATYSNRERPTDRPPLLRRLDTCQSPRETCPEQFRVSTSLSLSLSLSLPLRAPAKHFSSSYSSHGREESDSKMEKHTICMCAGRERERERERVRKRGKGGEWLPPGEGGRRKQAARRKRRDKRREIGRVCRSRRSVQRKILLPAKNSTDPSLARGTRRAVGNFVNERSPVSRPVQEKREGGREGGKEKKEKKGKKRRHPDRRNILRLDFS